jgi:hypothetical protein
MLKYPLLYFDFHSTKDNMIYENTLLVCPISLRSMIYKGRIEIIDVIDDRLYLLNTDTDDEFFLDTPYTGHYDDEGIEKKIKSHIKRHEVRLMTLRNVFTMLIDPKYIILKKNGSHIINIDYYTNKLTYTNDFINTYFHPKSVAYMIQYYSKSEDIYKFIAIIGKNINDEKITGYDQDYTGTLKYIDTHRKFLIKKRAYVYPIFWFMIERFYNDVEIKVI